VGLWKSLIPGDPLRRVRLELPSAEPLLAVRSGR
jgi:hypothetical protein